MQKTTGGLRSTLGIVGMLVPFVLMGCGGSGTSSNGTTGNITGTVTRVITPGLESSTAIRLPEADTDVEIYQNNTLKEKSHTDKDGRFTISLPPGHYLVKPSDTLSDKTPVEIGSQEVTVSAGQTSSVALEITIPGV